MYHTRTASITTRAEFIRFSESLFRSIPSNVFHRPKTPFDMIITGDVRSAKSLTLLSGLYALDATQNVKDLLGQKPKNRDFGTHTPYSIETYLGRANLKKIKMNEQEAMICFASDLCYPDNLEKYKYGQKLFDAHHLFQDTGGINAISLLGLQAKELRKYENFVAVPLIIDVRYTSVNHGFFDKVYGNGIKWLSDLFLMKANENALSLEGEWRNIALGGASADLPLARQITLYINDDTKMGAELMRDKTFKAFWDATTCHSNDSSNLDSRAISDRISDCKPRAMSPLKR